jgi:hypothetical protein
MPSADMSVYLRESPSWTDKELRHAATEGATIRTRQRLVVTWDPRQDNDSEPWADAAGRRYPPWYLHPECSKGCPWIGHRDGAHGVTTLPAQES